MKLKLKTLFFGVCLSIFCGMALNCVKAIPIGDEGKKHKVLITRLNRVIERNSTDPGCINLSCYLESRFYKLIMRDVIRRLSKEDADWYYIYKICEYVNDRAAPLSSDEVNAELRAITEEFQIWT